MTRDEVAAVGRRLLGTTTSAMATREYGLLARLLGADEQIEAMIIGRLRGGGLVGSQRLVVATSNRILLVEKGFVTGRERIRELDWEQVTGVELEPPFGLALLLQAEERVGLSMAQPPKQIGALADVVRARVDPSPGTRTTSAELFELVRRKLGRVWSIGYESEVLALAGELELEETVLEVAFTGGGTAPGLLVATVTRVVLVPSARLGTGPVVSHPYETIAGCEIREDGSTAVTGAGGEDLLRFEGIAPVERALSLVEIIQRRAAA